MLQAIRERAQGWIAWVIVGFISIPFAFWGVNSYFGGGSEAPVVTVDEREIGQYEYRRAYNNHRYRLRAMLGENYRPELFPEERIRGQVIDTLIGDEVARQAAQAQGYQVSDQQVAQLIQGEAAFQVDGKFDKQRFDNYLRQSGESAESFGEQIRGAIVRGQLDNALRGSEFVTEHTLGELQRLRDQKRKFQYLLVESASFEDQQPEQEAIEAYYQEHLNRYQTPEEVKVAYLEIMLEEIANTIEPEEEALRERYAGEKERFSSAEDRRVRHILVTVDDVQSDEQDAVAKAQALALLEELRSGADFPAVAKRASQDPGSAEQGGDLGYIGRGIMDPAFERRAYELEQGVVSEPLRTGFGYHLLEVTEIKAGSTQPFAEVRDELGQALRRELAEEQFFDQAEQLANLTYENPQTLEVAAESLGLSIAESDWFSAAGGAGIAAHSPVVKAAFSDEVLLRNNNSEPVEISTEHLVVARNLEHKASVQQPLEEVRDKIVEVLKGELADAAARELGEQLKGRLEGGEEMAQIATVQELELHTPEPLTRNGGGVPRQIVSQLFRLTKPAGGAVTFHGLHLANGDYALLAFQEVVEAEGEAGEQQARESLANTVTRGRGQALIQAVADSLRAKAVVVMGGREQ